MKKVPVIDPQEASQIHASRWKLASLNHNNCRDLLSGTVTYIVNEGEAGTFDFVFSDGDNGGYRLQGSYESTSGTGLYTGLTATIQGNPPPAR